MCPFASCNKKCPYKKCSTDPSKNHTDIRSRRNNGPLGLYSLRSANDVLLVFEAPGIDEWSKSEPICSNRRGSAGYKFNTELNNQGKQKTNYDIAEAVRCFPGTSTNSGNQKDQKELEKAAKYCRKYLKDIIQSKNYKKIVCFGQVAEHNVLQIMLSLIKQKHSHYNRSYLNTSVVNLKHPMKSTTLPRDIKTHL